MKKLLRNKLLLASVLLSFPLTGCSNEPNYSNFTPGEYDFSFFVESKEISNIINGIKNEFENDHDGVKLNIRYIYAGEGNNNSISDLWFSSLGKTEDYLFNNQIEILDSYYRNDIKDRLADNCYEAFRHNDIFPSFPIGIVPESIFAYDNVLFEGHNVNNWHDIIDRTNLLVGDYHHAFLNLSPEQYFTLFSSHGVDTIINEHDVIDNLNTEQGLQVAKALSSLLADSSIDSGIYSLSDKKYATCTGSIYQADMIEDYFGDNLKYASHLPSLLFEDEYSDWNSTYVTLGLFIKKQNNSDMKDVLMSFANYISKCDNLVSSFKNQYYYSVYKDVDRSIGNYDYLKESIKDGKEYSTYPIDWYYSVRKLINDIKSDNGNLNEELLMKALNDYHDNVLSLKTSQI